MPTAATPDRDVIDRVVQALLRARSTLVITGAGVSAASGLPTYRGIGGLYEGAGTEDNVAIEDALSGSMLKRRPALCWKYLKQIGAACLGAGPNAAHHHLAGLERALPNVWTLTQNIDGFHRAAGSRNLVEIHGSMGDLDCMDCGASVSGHAVTEVISRASDEQAPRCSDCGGVLRPRVVLFGEMLPQHAVLAYHDIMRLQPDVVLSIGTTSVFPYIAEPVLQARQRAALSVEINPGHSDVSAFVDVRLRTTAVAALDAIRAGLKARGR